MVVKINKKFSTPVPIWNSLDMLENVTISSLEKYVKHAFYIKFNVLSNVFLWIFLALILNRKSNSGLSLDGMGGRKLGISH